jgi:steroid 5-alpha reductase family enzyme
MKKSVRNAYIIFPVLIVSGLSFALAVSKGGPLIMGIPFFAFLVGISFLIQWLVFIPAYLLQSEKFFDLTGSITYIIIASVAVFSSKDFHPRSILLWFLILVWAIRLGGFLFNRIQKSGKDDRFDELKTSFIRFLNVWTIQGLWVSITLAAALVAMTTSHRKAIGMYAVVGILLWVVGFVIEVIADYQKSRFNKNPDNRGKFIQTGLWSRSRHPNYFGEIMLWIGIAMISLPVFKGLQWIAMISPVFVILLLTRVSGIPLLEKKADKKWGGRKEYEDYKKRTPVLIPKFK